MTQPAVPPEGLASDVVRRVEMLVVAALLILVLLPAAIAAAAGD